MNIITELINIPQNQRDSKNTRGEASCCDGVVVGLRREGDAVMVSWDSEFRVLANNFILGVK
jgi:hypothetical protein